MSLTIRGSCAAVHAGKDAALSRKQEAMWGHSSRLCSGHRRCLSRWRSPTSASPSRALQALCSGVRAIIFGTFYPETDIILHKRASFIPLPSPAGSVAARVCLCKMSNCDAHTKHDVVGAAPVTLITGHFPARCCGSRHISSDCGYPALETAKLACNSQLQLAKMGAYIQ